MVFLPSHRHPKPWAAYATAAIVLHGLAIALLLNGAGNGPQNEPMEIELVELAPDPFTAPPLDNPPADLPAPEPNPVDSTPIEPSDTDTAVATDRNQTIPADPTRPDPTRPDPTPSNPAPSEQLPPDQPLPAPNTPVPNTPVPNTPVPNTPDPNTPAPNTPAPNTPAPNTPAPATPNPADIPTGDINVPAKSKGIGLNVGLTIASHSSSDIPLIRRATPKETSQQFVLDPSQFACTRFVTPEADRDMGQAVTLNLAIDAQGQVTDITAREALSPAYLDLARCIVSTWSFDPAIDQTEQGEQRPRPDNATVTLTLQSQSL
jgi:outer membrane biosynthesis protein TonB